MNTLTHWIALPVLLPIVSAALLLLMRGRGLKFQRAFNGLSVAILLAAVVWLLFSGAAEHRLVYPLGDWPAPFGIVWVYDRLSGLMLVLTALLAAISLTYAIATGEDRNGAHFHPLFQAQLFGLNGAFLTGDVFNLFVFFEVLLLASYGLMLHGGGRKRTRAGLHYVVVNLVGSTLFLFAVGALYGTLGTLNLADLAQRVAHVPPADVGLVAAASLMLFVVFAIKAAAFPLYLWLPGTYAETSAPVAALFAIMTKVGLYAMLRVHGTMFGDDPHSALYALISPWLLWLGLITLIMATLGILAAQVLRRQIAYLILASVGTIMIALGLNSPAALSGGLYYWIHTTLLSAGFFLLADIIRRGRGDTGDRLVPGPTMPTIVFTGSIFFVYALTLAGLPPMTGFFGKLLILHAALGNEMRTPIFAAVLMTSLLIVIALARSGSRLFYRATEPHLPHAVTSPRLRTWQWLTVFVPLAVSVAMVLGANPVSHWLDATSAQTRDTAGYIHAVFDQAPAFRPHPEHHP